MTNSIYVVVGKSGSSPVKTRGWKDARKLLVYTSEARARSAMKSRSVNVNDYDIIEYVPKEGSE